MEQVIWYHIALLTKPWNKIENMNIWKQSTGRADRNKFSYKEIPVGGKSKKIFETPGPQFFVVIYVIYHFSSALAKS